MYDFIIESKDAEGMQISYNTLTRAQKGSLTGGGCWLETMTADHQYSTKSVVMAKQIKAHYQKVILFRKKDGIEIHDQ